MYEDKPKKMEINWKSLIIKLVILLVAVFIILWIVSLVNGSKKEEKPSNIKANLEIMKDASLEYFTLSRLPSNVNGTKKITLGEMIDTKLLIEFKDQNGNACDMKESYAEATKINNTDYTIKVKLVCGNESDYVINTVNMNKEETNSNENTNKETKTETNKNTTNKENTNTNNTNTNNSTKTNTNNTNKPTTNNKTVTNTNTNNSTKKSNTKTNSNNTSKKTTTTKKSNPSTTKKVTTNTTCNYGNLSYASINPLAYVISGKCAVSETTLNSGKYMNTATNIGSREYKKIVTEMVNLGNSKGVDLAVDSPKYSPVKNKSNKGYVGFQIYFTVRESKTGRVIYSYYLNTNGSRKTIIDNRSSLNKNANSNTYNSYVKVN